MLQNSFPYICFDWTCMKIKSAASVFSSIAFSRAKMWDSNLWYYQGVMATVCCLLKQYYIYCHTDICNSFLQVLQLAKQQKLNTGDNLC